MKFHKHTVVNFITLNWTCPADHPTGNTDLKNNLITWVGNSKFVFHYLFHFILVVRFFGEMSFFCMVHMYISWPNFISAWTVLCFKKFIYIKIWDVERGWEYVLVDASFYWEFTCLMYCFYKALKFRALVLAMCVRKIWNVVFLGVVSVVGKINYTKLRFLLGHLKLLYYSNLHYLWAIY